MEKEASPILQEILIAAVLARGNGMDRGRITGQTALTTKVHGYQMSWKAKGPIIMRLLRRVIS